MRGFTHCFLYIVLLRAHQAFVAQTRPRAYCALVASMTARFAIEEGLIDAADVHSDYDESEVENIMEFEMLERIHEESLPANTLQYLKKADRKRDQEQTEFEVLGNNDKRRRRQELIRSKQITEKAIDAFVVVCKCGPHMPSQASKKVLECLGA
jgi:hypothetical protein